MADRLEDIYKNIDNISYESEKDIDNELINDIISNYKEEMTFLQKF